MRDCSHGHIVQVFIHIKGHYPYHTEIKRYFGGATIKRNTGRNSSLFIISEYELVFENNLLLTNFLNSLIDEFLKLCKVTKIND